MGKRILRNLKSRSYEVMEGANVPGRDVEALHTDRLSAVSAESNDDTFRRSNNNSIIGSIGSSSSSHYGHFNNGYNNVPNSQHDTLESIPRKVREPGADIEMTAAVSGVVPDDTFTVSHAIDALGFGKFQVKLSLLTGLCWMADSMEMMILSIIAPALHCEWNINKFQQASLTNVVFAGMMLSSPFWGNLSDRYGRRRTLWISVGALFVYGSISAFSNMFLTLVLLRFFVGFAIGCGPQSVTLYAEFLPTKQRTRCVILLDCFWAFGACLEVLLALLVMPTLDNGNGWRWLLGLSSLPVFIFCIMCYWLPESVRFLAASGETDKAMKTLGRIAEENGRPMLLGRLIVDDMHPQERGRFMDLLMPEMRKTTLLLWFIWMACAFCYYGVVFMSTEILLQDYVEEAAQLASLLNKTESSGMVDSLIAHSNLTMVSFNNGTSSEPCPMLRQSDYVKLLWTTLAEFPGILLTIFVLDKIGRKKTMAMQFIFFSFAIFAFCFHIHNPVLKTLLLFLTRGIVSGVFQAAYVYTPEVYPTNMRAIGIGTCSSMARIGAMATPYVAQVILKSNVAFAVTLYGSVAIVAACLTLFLPIETKGRELSDRVTKT